MFCSLVNDFIRLKEIIESQQEAYIAYLIPIRDRSICIDIEVSFRIGGGVGCNGVFNLRCDPEFTGIIYKAG